MPLGLYFARLIFTYILGNPADNTSGTLLCSSRQFYELMNYTVMMNQDFAYIFALYLYL